jgi:hypothetical protein
MSYDNLSSVSQNVLKFYQQFTGEERRIRFIFDDFHFCHSRVIFNSYNKNVICIIRFCYIFNLSSYFYHNLYNSVLLCFQRGRGHDLYLQFVKLFLS